MFGMGGEGGLTTSYVSCYSCMVKANQCSVDVVFGDILSLH